MVRIRRSFPIGWILIGKNEANEASQRGASPKTGSQVSSQGFNNYCTGPGFHTGRRDTANLKVSQLICFQSGKCGLFFIKLPRTCKPSFLPEFFVELKTYNLDLLKILAQILRSCKLRVCKTFRFFKMTTQRSKPPVSASLDSATY